MRSTTAIRLYTVGMEEPGKESETAMYHSILFVRSAMPKESWWRPRRYTIRNHCHKEVHMMQKI